MFIALQVIFSIVILVTSSILSSNATFVTEESMQDLQDPVNTNWHYKDTIVHREKRGVLGELLKRLKGCCTIKYSDFRKKENEVAKECEDYLIAKLGGTENLAKAREDFPTGVYMCSRLCVDEKLGVLDSKKRIKEDAAFEYILNLYGTDEGKAAARDNFSLCFNRKDRFYEVVKDKSISCPDTFRGVFRCVRESIILMCPEGSQVETDECEATRQETLEEFEKWSSQRKKT